MNEARKLILKNPTFLLVAPKLLTPPRVTGCKTGPRPELVTLGGCVTIVLWLLRIWPTQGRPLFQSTPQASYFDFGHGTG